MRVIQRYNRKICPTEFSDLYGLEIKLCLIIKTLGVTGACPRSAFRQPPPTYRSFSHQPSNHSGICRPSHRLRGKIAVVEVKNPFVDFDRRECTALSLRRFFKSSKEDKRWRCSVMTRLCVMEVQGQRSGRRSALSVKVASDTSDAGEHFSDERRAPSTG